LDKDQVVTKSLVNMLKKFITQQRLQWNSLVQKKLIINLICAIFYHCMRG